MNRRDFLQLCTLFGLSSVAGSCRFADDEKPRSSSQSVIIIGAGAAGMSAGYLLGQAGVPFTILEASGSYGGRMKRTRSFTDFPIPLGAEWLHVHRKELSRIINNGTQSIDTRLAGYSGKDTVGYYDGVRLTLSTLSDEFGSAFQDQKFIHSSWYDFFATYLLPAIQSQIQLNVPVQAIDYQHEQVVVTDVHGVQHKADRVIITVPIKMLQNDAIAFTPALPVTKRKQLQKAPIWGGLKAFIECSSAFYPTFLAFADSENRHGQRLYYDAAYGQESASHVLGLFAVGAQAERYRQTSSDAQLRVILDELDGIFQGVASKHYIKHIVQDWNEEPYIQSAYLADHAPSSISRHLFTPIANKVYFAGDSYTQQDDWGGVHNATRSARDVVQAIIQL